MILDFVDKNNIVRIIDINQVVSVIYIPNYEGTEGRVIFYLNGGHKIPFTPPVDMDMDLILASVANNMKRKGHNINLDEVVGIGK